MHFPSGRRPRLETSVTDSRLLPRTRGESALHKPQGRMIIHLTLHKGAYRVV